MPITLHQEGLNIDYDRYDISDEQEDQIHTIFKLFEEKREKGKMKVASLPEAFVKLGLELQKEIDVLDSNVLNFHEFRELVVLEIQRLSFYDEIKEAFKLYDTDRDGKITATDLLAKRPEDTSSHFSIEEAMELLQLVDEDKDGKINLQQFTKLMTGEVMQHH